MTTHRHRVFKNLYKDSVSLLAVSAKVTEVAGVDAASIVMGTPTNLDNLAAAGLGTDFGAGPNDLIVAVRGAEEACETALELADSLLADNPAQGGSRDTEPHRPTSISTAVAADPAANLALISVPGDYAAAEALKALNLGLHVMIFSDNVPVAHELEVKQRARALGLMVMGPDCGTAIINGVPLGFANVVRRGPIGVVGASGTGMQEITSRIHQLGSGISQALGTGGHDLSAEIGGISVLTGLRALAEDDATEVIVLVSKPPSGEVAAAVLAQARSIAKPVVVIFLGADPASISGDGVHGAHTLAGAADIAVDLVNGRPVEPSPITVKAGDARVLAETARTFAPGQRYVRGVFAGGTFCFEAQLICRSRGIAAYSNTPAKGNLPLQDVRSSREHTIVDMGDDEFTQGRPHPMIDPTERNERLRQDAADPETAVLLLDVVLGYGAADDPVSGLVETLTKAKADAEGEGRSLAVVASVCGTDRDQQGRDGVVAALRGVGVLVAESNAEAAAWAADLVLASDR
ncbi:acyl-CoA synthetase FdrA [Dactylosporangium salmoneum]|uniref:Acyl-CoA synthetase FdrA n=1 Tax=Dactylosporangium salmoneum TaxID=53361 RepID=A0ABP5TS61_9ACTN